MINYLEFEYLLNGNKEQKNVYDILEKLKIRECLYKYNPTLVGTIPININIPSSDIDIICEVYDFEEFEDSIKNLNCLYEKVIKIHQDKESHIYKFDFLNKEIEIFAQSVKVDDQNGYKHMMVENDILAKLGDKFRYNVIELKKVGFKTEHAFCELLGIEGDVYKELLKVDNYDKLSWCNKFRLLPIYNEITKINKINKGWSTDKKYYIEADSKKYLLRESGLDTYEKKLCEFNNIRLITETDLLVPKPILISNEYNTLLLFKWVVGEDLDDAINKFTVNQQYKLGYDAGLILKEIHKITSESINWYEKYSTKIDRIINDYLKCEVSFKNDDKVIEFINKYKYVLKNRPITFQHGDFHIGNMLLTPEKEVGIIDFNRSSFGDPWEEYDRFVFTWNASTEFATGQLDGYFDGSIPDEFFKVMAVYNATNLLASIPWAIPFGDEDVNTMLRNAELILDAYDNFKEYTPSWYTKQIKKNK